MVLEYQRYGRNKNTLINKSYINSGEYRRKFDNISDNPKLNKTLYNKAKTALKHRNGTSYEDMYWIDTDSGKVVASEENSNIKQAIVYSDSVKKKVSSYENKKLVTIHTHPNSMPPSIADFNSCYKNNYEKCIVACHDGSVFVYSSNEYVDEVLYESYIKKYLSKGYNEYDAQFNALNELSKSHDITIQRIDHKV